MTTRITIVVVILYGLISLGFLLSADHAPVSEVRPPLVEFESQLPQISANTWGVFDLAAGTMLYGERATSVVPIASVTKLFTAAATHKYFAPTTTATVFWTDLTAEGRAGSLQQGQVLTYQELLFPLLLESSNDAAAVLGRSIGIEWFQSELRGFIEESKLTQTTIVEPSGLSSDNQSSVADLGTLLAHLHTQIPHVIDITSLRTYYTPEFGWHNNSPFINDVGYVGGKHGYIEAAGRTAAVIFDEQFTRGETVRIGYVVLGSQDLLGDVRALRELIRTRGLGM